MKVDFIVVGQGIAGTSFAFELLKNNKTFVLVDKFNAHTASRVALGVYNPLILKWFTKAWDIDNQLDYFYIFYNQLNHFLGDNLFSDIGIYKFLKNPYDQNNWLTKQSSSCRYQYMSKDLYSINNQGLINKNPYGLVKSAGKVNVQLLLNLFRDYCINKNLLLDTKLDYNKLKIDSNAIRFEGVEANKIIFCQGYAGIDNPYFNNLNFKPTKGEILTIYSKDLNLDKIIHSGFLFTPVGNDHYSIGATYDWKDMTINPTLQAKKKLIDGLNSILQTEFTIINHQVGIRPSTFDRRPFVDVHKKYSNLYVLNGLGTRGIILAPYLSKLLINSIYKNGTINNEISINRE